MFAAIVTHNAGTHETFESQFPNATHGAIEYGWPVTCITGAISVEAMFYATMPRQHWASTESVQVDFLGLLVDLAVGLLLSVSTFKGLAWAFLSFNSKLTIATLLGLIAYLALLFAFEATDSASRFEMFPQLKELFVETYAFDYIEKLVWFSMFVTCLWIPNWLGASVRTKAVGG